MGAWEIKNNNNKTIPTVVLSTAPETIHHATDYAPKFSFLITFLFLILVLSSDPSNDLFDSSIWFIGNLYTNILNALRI